MRNWIDLVEATAWHGSPHRFDVFDIQKINSGEGNQAYGWGLYVAQERDVADYYRKAASIKDEKATYDGQPIDRYDYMVAIPALLAAMGDKEAAKEREPNFADTIDEIDLDKVEFHGGHLYEVEIPGDEFFLFWDVPLSQQSAFVKKALKRIPDSQSDRPSVLARFVQQCVRDDDNGHVLYHHLGNFLRNETGLAYDDWPKAASELLRRAGILGIKYLDGVSRDGDAATANYVLFDSGSIKVLSRT